LEPEARPETPALLKLAFSAIALTLTLAPSDALAGRSARHHKPLDPPAVRHFPYPDLELPFQINGGQYAPVAWSEIAGWSDDDQLAAFKAFQISCKPIVAQQKPPADPKALGTSLRDPCRVARSLELSDNAKARAFFEEHFVPLRISRLGEAEGFVTGYYEPIVEGSKEENEVYKVPVYRRPSNLFVRGTTQSSAGLPNKGQVFRKIGRRKLVPYYDRGEIEDGAIAGRGLEICFLTNQTDLLFTQIQGSARVSLDVVFSLRLHPPAYTGFPYTPVGRILIERNIVPKDQMSMQRIREWMEQNPNEADELRRQNKSYVFFREVQLSDKDEAVGAQGVPLTPGRSIAVDKALHVYGTPFFIEGELPIETAQSKNPFRRLMIAQDTGSAIVGPARADLYFGAGAEAGKVSGRLRHNARFVVLVPKSLDPVARGRQLPLPDDRPSEVIAKLFPQTDPSPQKTAAKPAEVTATATPSTAQPAAPSAAASPQATSAQVAVVGPVPLPEPRPKLEPASVKPKPRQQRRYRTYR